MAAHLLPISVAVSVCGVNAPDAVHQTEALAMRATKMETTRMATVLAMEIKSNGNVVFVRVVDALVVDHDHVRVNQVILIYDLFFIWIEENESLTISIDRWQC